MFYEVTKATLGPMIQMLFRPWVEGAEYVPREGAAIIASNHVSFSDSFFMPVLLPRKVIFLAKQEYFIGTGVKGMLTRAFFSGVGQVPVDRAGGQASEAALRAGRRVLDRGELLGIYPEGTRSPDGRLYRGKTGVARLAIEAKVPVVPCAMINTAEIQPPGQVVPKLGIRPGVRFGKPLDFSRYEGLERDRYVLRAATDELMYILMSMSGQEYVDMYAATRKAQIAAAKKGREAAEAGAAGVEERERSEETRTAL